MNRITDANITNTNASSSRYPKQRQQSRVCCIDKNHRRCRNKFGGINDNRFLLLLLSFVIAVVSTFLLITTSLSIIIQQNSVEAFRSCSSMKNLIKPTQQGTTFVVPSYNNNRCRRSKKNIIVRNSSNRPSDSSNIQRTTSATTTQQSPPQQQNENFWEQQQQLIENIKERERLSQKEITRTKYQQRAAALVSDTVYLSFLLFCSLWIVVDNPFTSFSYAIGTSCGIAYTYGLSKYVETIGSSPLDETTGEISAESIGSSTGIGTARFAFLALLFIVVSKFRTIGFQEIPAILGFFTYQIASLTQGLREIND